MLQEENSDTDSGLVTGDVPTTMRFPSVKLIWTFRKIPGINWSPNSSKSLPVSSEIQNPQEDCPDPEKTALGPATD